MTKEQIEVYIESLEDDIKKSERRRGLGTRNTFEYEFYSNQLECLLKESKSLQNQLKEMENTQSPQNEIPTKAELLAAGAKEFGMSLAKEVGETTLHIAISIDGKQAYLQTKEHVTLKIFDATKSKINAAYQFFTGKPLDFTVKEEFSWETCFDESACKFSAEDCAKHALQSGAPYFKHEWQAKKALAEAQLSWIVPKIEEAYPVKEEDYSCTIYYDAEYRELDFFHCTENGYKVKSQFIARKLIVTHPQLLKDALGIVE